jgi:hypothetical protein
MHLQYLGKRRLAPSSALVLVSLPRGVPTLHEWRRRFVEVADTPPQGCLQVDRLVAFVQKIREGFVKSRSVTRTSSQVRCSPPIAFGLCPPICPGAALPVLRARSTTGSPS